MGNDKLTDKLIAVKQKFIELSEPHNLKEEKGFEKRFLVADCFIRSFKLVDESFDYLDFNKLVGRNIKLHKPPNNCYDVFIATIDTMIRYSKLKAFL